MAEWLNNFWVKFHYPRGRYVRLPHFLTERVHDEFSDYVEIHTRDGRLWIIRLLHENNEIWLGDGWNEFKNHYNIQYRDSLYFMYQLDNIFEVVIFGMNGLEKSTENAMKDRRAVYFFKQLKTKGSTAKMVVPDAFSTKFGKYLRKPIYLAGLDGVETAVDWSSTRKWENLTFLGGWEAFVNMNHIRRLDMLIFKFAWNQQMTVDVLSPDSGCIDQFHTGTIPEPWDVDNHLFELFSVTLNQSFEKRKQPLYVPARVVKRELSHKPEEITVQLPTGEYELWSMIWTVGKSECKIGRGWYEFKDNNNLEVGDVVKFGRRGMQPYFEIDVE